MTAIQFYHLTTTSLERALPKLLEKAYQSGLKALVLAQGDEQAERLNRLLWTYDAGSFLPHGGMRDGNRQLQPILLAAEPPNDYPAQLAVVTDGRQLSHPDSYERVLDLFDGTDAGEVERARARWTGYKQAGHELLYRRQNAQGGWMQE